MAMSKITYYADSTVRVTSEWVRLGEKVYSVADIKSVKVKCAQPKSLRELPYFLMIVGSITTFTLLNVKHLFPRDWESILPGMLSLSAIIGFAGLVLLPAQAVLTPACIYAVRLRGSFGEASPFASDDEQYVSKVVDAIGTAINVAARVATDLESAELPFSSPSTVDAQA